MASCTSVGCTRGAEVDNAWTGERACATHRFGMFGMNKAMTSAVRMYTRGYEAFAAHDWNEAQQSFEGFLAAMWQHRTGVPEHLREAKWRAHLAVCLARAEMYKRGQGTHSLDVARKHAAYLYRDHRTEHALCIRAINDAAAVAAGAGGRGEAGEAGLA